MSEEKKKEKKEQRRTFFEFRKALPPSFTQSKEKPKRIEKMENRLNRITAFIHSSHMFRVTCGTALKRRFLYSLDPRIHVIFTSWMLGFYGAGLMVFGWWFMCGFVPTLPQPLPPLINWSIITVLSVFAATVDKIRKGNQG